MKSPNRQPQNRYHHLLINLIFAALLLGLMACASQESASIAADSSAGFAGESASDMMAPSAETEMPASDANAVILPTALAPNQQDSGAATPRNANRMIIKNGQLGILVEDTDDAINRVMGAIVGFDGYVVDTRTWLSGEQKYATLTIGVPSEHFENMIQRLKEVGLSVTNETISGEDVSDQFVDLQSRLRNLEATAARIREFLQQTKNVEEALQVSDRLSEIEGQIEQVKGRMNYLQDRAAFSTITLEISPERPLIAPDSNWRPGRTVAEAWASTVRLFQGVVDLLIWVVVVVVPCLIPVALVGWLGWQGVKRFRKQATVE